MDHAQSVFHKFEIDIFTATQDLYQKLIHGICYDIIFLDIQFRNPIKKSEGIELASLIRTELNNKLVDIVFISKHTIYIQEMFKATPSNFITKPTQKGRIISVVDNLIKIYENKIKIFFEYKIGGQVNRIDLKDIICLWVDNRIIHIKTTKMEDTFYGTLKSTYEQLKNYDFVRVNKSYIVNYNYISSFSPAELILETKEVISLSQRGFEDLDQFCSMKNNQYKVSDFY